MRHGPLLLLLPLLLACTADLPSAVPDPDPQDLASRAGEIGTVVRAAQLCAIPLSQPAQDRAARIEAAAIAFHMRHGGMPARDSFLRGMAPPRFDDRARSRDRIAWCASQRPEVQALDTMLNSEEGTTLVQRAEAAEAGLGLRQGGSP